MSISSEHADPEPATAIIFGASGGIGAALLANLHSRKQFANLAGLSRGSQPPIDLLDESSIRSAAAHLAAHAAPLRLLIDATGMLADGDSRPERSWRELDAAHLARAFAINAVGPALLMKHFLPLLPRQGRSVFVSLSARVGSIADNNLGGWYSYRASKAALNQLVHTAAIELKRQSPQAVCVALHPGTVDTKLSAPFRTSHLEVRTPESAAELILQAIDGLSAADTGGFFDYRGLAIPW